MISKVNAIEFKGKSLNRIFVGRADELFFTLDKIDKKSNINWYDAEFSLIANEEFENELLSMFGTYDYHKLLLDNRTKQKLFTIKDLEIEHLDRHDISKWKFSNSHDAVSDKYIRVGLIEDGRLFFSLYNLANNSISVKKPYSLHLYDNYLFTYRDLTVKKLDEHSLEPLWSKDYTTELDHIEGMNRVMAPIIGVHSDVFVFSYQGKWLVGIDIHSGEISWKVRGNWSKSQILDNGNIFVMVGSQMRLRDIKTGELIGEYGEIEGKIGPQRMNYTFIGDHVILTGRPSDTIGAYNTMTYKYDWIYKEEGTQWSPQPMKYYHPYLFVNDTKGNLHVFKVDDELEK